MLVLSNWADWNKFEGKPYYLWVIKSMITFLTEAGQHTLNLCRSQFIIVFNQYFISYWYLISRPWMKMFTYVFTLNLVIKSFSNNRKPGVRNPAGHIFTFSKNWKLKKISKMSKFVQTLQTFCKHLQALHGHLHKVAFRSAKFFFVPRNLLREITLISQ